MNRNIFLISSESLGLKVRSLKVAYLAESVHRSQVHQLLINSLGSIKYEVTPGYPNPSYHYQLKKQQVE